MELNVTEKAAQWYENELEVEDTSLRFYVRYGGSGLQPGFSLAIKIEQPENPVALKRAGSIDYFIEEEDTWYFDSHSLTVDFDETWQEPNFNYEKNDS